MARGARSGRSVHGILVLDKPLHLSSNHALQRVKRMFQAKKAGHTGSLDPLASGVLPLCFGHATKISQFLLDSDKRYRFDMALGVTTTTGDVEGEVLQSRSVPALSESKLRQVLQRFCGSIEQIPPMYSAIKHQGQPLYKLARAGLDVERKTRTVTIHQLDLIDYNEAVCSLQVHCSKGTYVRTLAQDIGEALDCGAHVSMLRRIQAGPFDLDQAVTLEQLSLTAETGLSELDACLRPLDSALQGIPELHFSNQQVSDLMLGRSVVLPGAPQSPLIRMYNEQRELIGLGKAGGDGLVSPSRIFNPDQ